MPAGGQTTATRGHGASTPSSQRAVVAAAARAHHVDPNVLWGIYGAESSWGKSSNWFGLVAVPRTGSFAGDANASAATLERLLKENGGSYERALRHYSGNSYGLDHVKQLARQSGTPVGIAADVSGASASASDATTGGFSVPNPLGGIDAIGAFFGALLDPHTWARIGKIALGSLLIVFAVYEFASQSKIGAQVVTNVKRGAAAAALA